MKNKVIQHFKNLPTDKASQFNAAFNLYRNCPGKNLGQERFYNQSGFTQANLENINYDLKKLVGITDADIRRAQSVILNEAPKQDIIQAEKKLQENILEMSGATTKEEVFTKAPGNVKTQIKLRDEFPFLNEDDCPEEFYILVGKKFNYYDAWVKAHKALLVNIKDIEEDASPIEMTSEEVNELALSAVENFEVNQAIWKELNHYNETKQVLGEHPIFLERKLKDSIDTMTVADASKRLANLDNYIRRDKRHLAKAEKAKNEADIEKYTKKIIGWETEEKLIKAKHNL